MPVGPVTNTVTIATANLEIVIALSSLILRWVWERKVFWPPVPRYTFCPSASSEQHLEPQSDDRRRTDTFPAGDKRYADGAGSGADRDLFLLRPSDNLDVRRQL